MQPINTLQTNSVQNTNMSLGADVVSFSGKNYDAESVLNPTNHCAYCGCKVYTEAQIDSIAQEMLQSKSSRLEGKVKSVLEKLSEGKNSQEISTAKRIENKEEIKFFENFLDVASKKSFLRGDAIFEQVYDMEREDAQKLLVKNMHPLIKTIDHVSPQNKKQENNNIDANLVEACYCCNHDLKKGASFNEFYTMFPSVKHNMPKDKFEFAMAQLLDSSQSNVKQRLSATNMLKHLERLFVQRTEAAAYLDSVDFKIKSCNDGIDDAVQSCETDIAKKQEELDDLEQKLSALAADDEYQALVKRAKLETDINNSTLMQEGLRAKKQRISTALNDLNSGKAKTKKQTGRGDKKAEMTEEEKKEKAQEYKIQLADINSGIESENENIENLKFQLALLNEAHPTVEMYQIRKNKADGIVNAYVSQNAETRNKEILHKKYEAASEREAELTQELEKYPKDDFDAAAFAPEQRAIYDRYLQVLEALDFIQTHPNGNAIRQIINQSAVKQINDEIASLESEPSVQKYNFYKQKEELKGELQQVMEAKKSLSEKIKESEKTLKHLKTVTAGISKEKAEETSRNAAASIRMLNEKQNLLKIPQRVSVLKAEIMFLNSTISDLRERQKQIHEAYQNK